jgi:hypothetical protein
VNDVICAAIKKQKTAYFRRGGFKFCKNDILSGENCAQGAFLHLLKIYFARMTFAMFSRGKNPLLRHYFRLCRSKPAAAPRRIFSVRQPAELIKSWRRQRGKFD